MIKVNRTIGDDLQLRLQNLQLLVQRILHFYEVIFEQRISLIITICLLPECITISGHYSITKCHYYQPGTRGR